MTLDAAITTLYARHASILVQVGGVAIASDNLLGTELSKAVDPNSAPVPTYKITLRELPPGVVIGSKVTADHGYNGLFVRRFTGEVDEIERQASSQDGSMTCVLACVGESDKLGQQLEIAARDFTGQTTPVAAAAILAAAGIGAREINMTAFTLGTNADAADPIGNYNTFLELLIKIIDINGHVLLELGTGVIRIAVMRAFPAPTAYRSYSTQGTTPRILAIRRKQGRREIASAVVVTGAVVTTTDADGNVTSSEPIQVRAVVSGANVRYSTNELNVNNPFIDTEAQAAEEAKRIAADQSCIVDELEIEVDGDPQVDLGFTIEVIDPDFVAVSGRYFVKSIQETFETGPAGESGQLITTFGLQGGPQSCGTATIEPICDFRWDTPRQVGDPTIVVAYHSEARSPDGTALTNFEWSDDQGNSASGADFEDITFEYTPGVEINMTLTVTDANANSCSITKKLKLPPATGLRDSVDVSIRDMVAAIFSHATQSEDGGESWEDFTPGALAVGGSIISCGADVSPSALASERGTFDTIRLWGTTAGEIVRTLDGDTFDVVFTHPSGSACNHVFVPIDFPNFIYACFENGDLYGSNIFGESGTWGLLSALGYPLKRVKTDPFSNGTIVRVCGGRGDQPSTLLQENLYPTGVSFLDAQAIPWISRSSSLAAGAQAEYCNDFDSPQLDWDEITLVIYGRATGVYGTADRGLTWAQGVGLAAATDYISVASGDTALPTKVVFRNSNINVYRSTDNLNYDEIVAALPVGAAPWHVLSDVNNLPLGKGLPLVFWGAINAGASGGIVKSFDDGLTWGYLRPFGAATWPAAANGRMVWLGAEFIVSRPAGEADVMQTAYKGNSTADSVLVRQGSDNAWVETADIVDTGNNTALDQAYQLEENPSTGTLFAIFYRYGTANAPTGTLRRSTDAGVTWANTPVTNCRSFCFDIDGNVYAVSNDGSQDDAASTTIKKSTNDGVAFSTIATLTLIP